MTHSKPSEPTPLACFLQAAGLARLEDERLGQSLPQVFEHSAFVAKSCLLRPQMLLELASSGDLYRNYDANTYRDRLRREILPELDEVTLLHRLRLLRNREMVRLAWRDICGWSDLDTAMAEMSGFADACLETVAEVCHQQLQAKYGQPRCAAGQPQEIVILGMGKLGAHELNYSSDIDLILAYPQYGQTHGGAHTISTDEYFTHLGRRLIKLLSQNTADGLVFRVDLNLRPYGDSGPLVMHFDAMENYYVQQGRDWERYAWIKARVAAGDQAAGATLLERLQPFVYRRYLDYGMFAGLRDMKARIALEVQRKGLQQNIKLGAGGIREIEFFGQIFQLIRGGVLPALQVRGIRPVLQYLTNLGLIPLQTQHELDQAYVFLRTTENRLQQYADQQTHQLPCDPADRQRLARALHFDNWEAFYARLRQVMDTVHGHFQGLLEQRRKHDTDSDQIELENDLLGVWRQLDDQCHGDRILQQAGYTRTKEVLRLLRDLQQHRTTRALSSEGRRRLDGLLPILLRHIGRCQSPLPVLSRVLDLLMAIQQRTSYLALLLENPAALQHLVSLVEASPLIASFLSRHPVLLDELLDARSLYLPPHPQALHQALQQQLALHTQDELEQQIEQLCIFKQTQVLKVAAADVSGSLALMRVSDHLTAIAETILQQVLEMAWGYLVQKHGEPVCQLKTGPCQRGFAVIAYGKLGGYEFGYASDLDLVFLHAAVPNSLTQGPKPIDNSQFYARLGQRVIHILTARTRVGVLYETDMRLRPSGNSGLLVCHVESFRQYQVEKAWLWEHQALVRARAVAGDPNLMVRFERIRKAILGQQRPSASLRRTVREMRRRLILEHAPRRADIFDLKHDRGGIVDIEFMVQYLVLHKAWRHTELLRWTDNVRLLQTLIESGVLTEFEGHYLKEAYLTFRAVGHKLSLQEKPEVVEGKRFRTLRLRVFTIWRRIMALKV